MMRTANLKRWKNRKTEKNSERSLLRYYMAGYFIVLFIPLMICSLYYMSMIRTISEDDIQAKKSALEHSVVRMDTMLNELDYLGDSLILNTEVNQFKRVKDPYEYPNAYQVNRLQEELPDLYQINSSIFGYYIFFNSSEMVINASIAYEYRDFFDLYLRPADADSYEEWLASVKDIPPVYGLKPERLYYYKVENELQEAEVEKQKNFLIYSRPLMLIGGNSSDSSGVIRFYIESSYIDTLMPGISENAGGAFLITNSKQEPLYYKISNEIVSEEQLLQIMDTESSVVTYGRDRYVQLHLKSVDNGLHYYMLYPEKSISVRRTSAMIAVVFCVATALFVGLILSLWMSRRSAGTVNEVLKEISKETEYYDSHLAVFSHLKSTYGKLMKENTVLSDALEKQKPFIRSAFMNRLIYGDYFPAAEIIKAVSSLEIPWQNRVLCVLVMRFSTGSPDLMNQNASWVESCVISFLEILEQKLPDSLYINTGDGQVILILNEEQCEEALFFRQAEQRIREIKEELPANIAERIFVCGGSLVTQFSDIHTSYNQAVHMFRKEKEQSENEIIWYRDTSDMIPLYPSIDMEMRLTYLVSSGDTKGLHDELGSLLNIYIIQNTMPIYLQQMLLSELQIIMLRILPSVSLEKEECQEYYRQLEKNHNCSLLDQITKTLHIYEEVCSCIQKKQEVSDSGTVIPAVVSYIECNYSDCNLSLNSVASAFEISESHLSTMFKQTTGVNFSSYLEGMRIDKAKQLLGTTQMKISEISEAIGYYSVNSFCRAFKRVTGSNASEYRSGAKK